ncbi:hypothetical protein CF319_g587 [Tilletia indica]|nr:hypothetical protein CF319_g587 [Tilletia indica]
MSSDDSSDPKQEGQEFGKIRQPINEDNLNAYLSKHVPSIASPVEVRQFTYGQSNPTYILTDTKGARYVLRKKPPGTLLSPTAHAIDREFRILQAVGKYNDSLPSSSSSSSAKPHEDAVPVPRVYCLCTENEVIGTPFYIMDFVEGRIFSDVRMLSMPIYKDRLTAWKSAIRTIANLHRIDPMQIGLDGYGKRSDFYPRQLKALSTVAGRQAEAQDAETGEKVGPIPDMEKITNWFSKNLPADENRIVHGDYKIDNLIYHPTEPYVIAVLDWELSTLGHPLSDLANLLQPFSLDCTIPHSPLSEIRQRLHDPEERINAVLERGELILMMGGLEELEEKVRREGGERVSPLPGKKELIRTYCEQVGRAYPIPVWTYCEAWAWFRLAVIAHGIAARVAKGQASSGQAQLYASKYPDAARSACVVIERDQPGVLARLEASTPKL